MRTVLSGLTAEHTRPIAGPVDVPEWQKETEKGLCPSLSGRSGLAPAGNGARILFQPCVRLPQGMPCWVAHAAVELVAWFLELPFATGDLEFLGSWVC